MPLTLSQILACSTEHLIDARTQCSTSDWIDRTTLLATGVVSTGILGLTAETGVGGVAAVASGLGTVVAGKNLLGCLVGSK